MDAPYAKMLPDNDIILKISRDFIMNSRLAQQALLSRCLQGKLSLLISNLIERIYRLSLSCHMPEFTDHGLPHICSLIDRISSWTRQDNNSIFENLTPDDTAKLLLGTIIHDLGMLSQKTEHLPNDSSIDDQLLLSPNISSWVRYTHVKRLNKLFLSLINEIKSESNFSIKRSTINNMFFEDVINIASCHEKWPWEWDKVFSNNTSEEKKVLTFLASIISIVDLLDEDSTRCDTMTMIKHRHGDELNRAHWIRHCLTDGRISINNSEIHIRLVSPPDFSVIHRHKLEPVYNAIRRHFNLINLYNEPLGMKINIVFSPNDGIPDDISLELKNWMEIAGFENESAFVYHLLNTFMAEVRGENIDLVNQTQFEKAFGCNTSSISMELSEYKSIKGDFIQRESYEKTFYSIKNQE